MGRLSPSRYKSIFYQKLQHGRQLEAAWDTTENKLAIAINGTVSALLSAGALAPVVTGDVEIASSGATTIATGAVGTTKIADDAITSAKLANSIIQQASGTIVAADIIATGAGKLGHAEGYPLVAAPGSGYVLEFLSALLIYDYDTAGYTDGGNVTVNLSGGGAAQSDPVAAADFCGAAADKMVVVRPPTAAAGVATVDNAGLNLVAAAAFTDPGTAAGIIRYVVTYRVHATGL
jgi:hypothetical protein